MLFKTDDEKFFNLPSFNNYHFYSYLKVNDDYEMIYCMFSRNSIIYLRDLDEQYEQFIHVSLIWNRENDTIELTLGRSEFREIDESLIDWKQVVTPREATDNELDAKYYCYTSYRGLNDDLRIEFIKPYLGNNNNWNINGSSVFTFKYWVNYKNQSQYNYYFHFLDDHKFSILNYYYDEIIPMVYGTYTSNKTGMTLHLEHNELFDTAGSTIELTAYVDG